MSTLLMDGRSFIPDNVPCNRRNHVLKSRENIFKPKYDKELKKKLKKYKLRRDGQEDPDIVDVSQTLITSLRIKSPNNQNNIKVQKATESEQNKRYNYLTKMVRLKKIENQLESNGPDVNCEIQKNNVTTDNLAVTEKKQTDAFKLLMDSRHKSIGSNSPGKEKCEEEIEAQENLKNQTEKKELKAKRLLSLNKMAQAKGSLKKMQMEEYIEESIKRKMEERAKRLKGMLKGDEIKNGGKSSLKTSEVEEIIETPKRSEISESKDATVSKTPILKTFDLFKDLKATPTNTKKKISKEDEEFLKKLSPSLKKKENMLCYFQKINKNSEILQESVEDVSQDSDQQVIKVKLKPKNKIKKKSKTVLSINEKLDRKTDIKGEDVPQSCIPNNEKHKRKRQAKVDVCNDIIANINIDDTVINSDDSRPKRNIKRPVKYNEDFQLSSSDEELHIFTPRKKRKEKLDTIINVILINDDNTEISSKNNNEKSNAYDEKQEKRKEIKNKSKKNLVAEPPKIKQTSVTKKATKLAPIFVAKPQLDSAALEAKQKFLHSGVPSQLKKNFTQQATILGTDEFPVVVHVQNLSNVNTDELNSFPNFNDINYTENIYIKEEKNLFKDLLEFSVFENHSMPKFQKNVDLVLKSIKASYPKFPVYRTYHLLRGKSKGEFKDCVYPELDNSVEIFNNIVDTHNINPDKLNWADKYKPTSEKQVLGNFGSIKELRKWLVNWTENNSKAKKNTDGSESSDFYQSDTDSRETMKNVNNLLIITGKVGSGKTLSVYAVAAELAIKVIEVNTSAKRTGKIMLQDLQEATQSHKVNRGNCSTECSQKSQESNKDSTKFKIMKKRGRKKKVIEDISSCASKTAKDSTEVMISQESTRTVMSLILIDDADIVFDQDDGFSSAISQLIQTSKRPVILVTSSLTCPHLQKFICLAKIIKMRPFLPRMLGTWLDIMCLADSNLCSPGLGAEVLDLFKGDIRKTINYLQFYVTSQKYLTDIDNKETTKDEDNVKINTDEENSCMSWGDNEGWGEKNETPNPDQVTWKNVELTHSSSLSSFNIWWNLPDHLNFNRKDDKNSVDSSKKSEKFRKIEELNTIAETLNTLSITDYWIRSNSDDVVNATSNPWYMSESASVIDSENFTSYNRNDVCLNDVAYELMTLRLSVAQRSLGCKNNAEIKYPSMTAYRERDQVVSRHKMLTSYLNASAFMDRRALALDYWPICRNICKTEKTKTDTNSKRNNRFCHYLKSLNVLCKNEYFDTLGESLSGCKKND